jgi:hypothetical protein
MAVLVFTALGSDDDRTKALAFRALELVAVGPLLATGLVCLLTGVLLGLGSRWPTRPHGPASSTLASRRRWRWAT